MKKVAIVGIRGYSGLELFRIFYYHPEVEVTKIYATSHYGEKLSEHFPQLEGLTDLTISEFNEEEIMAECDAVFFATSAGVSQKLALTFIDNNFPVIDLSGDFRLADLEIYNKWYKNTNLKNEYLALNIIWPTLVKQKQTISRIQVAMQQPHYLHFIR